MSLETPSHCEAAEPRKAGGAVLRSVVQAVPNESGIVAAADRPLRSQA